MQRKDTIRSAAMLGALIHIAGTTSAWAQETSSIGPVTEELEEVIVTGSNIRGASDSGAIAVSVLDAEKLAAFGQASTGELLENVAQAGAFEINGAADGPNDARGDIATVNLRGLGTGNTLVLLNGRRIAAHAANQDIGSTPRQVTNVNAFPAAGIERVEVLRDGASALYGSDATAGVLNTIMDADFDRSSITARYSSIEGTGEHETTVDFAQGLRFNEGRTNVLLTGSYFDRSGLFASELGQQFSSVDKRAYLGDSPYATETTDFRNTSTSSPFGQYQVGALNDLGVFVGRRVRQGTAALTSTSGVFHIQPCSFTGTRAEIGARAEGCMGIDDGILDPALRFASPPVCNSGTLCGNIANGSPVGDSMPILLALGAGVELRRGRATRRLPLDQFYLGYQRKDLQPGEFVAAVRVPRAAPGTHIASYKVSKRFDQDIAAVCAGFFIELDGDRVVTARLGFGGMAAVPARAKMAEAALSGSQWSAQSVEAAVAALSEDFQPLSDLRASKDYRLLAAGQLLRRFYRESRGETTLSLHALTPVAGRR